MLSNEEIKHLEDEINKILHSVERDFYQFSKQEEELVKEEYPGWTKDWIQYRIESLYYHIATYLEARGMTQLLQLFNNKFQNIIFDKKDLLKSKLFEPEGELQLEIPIEFRLFLDPFKAFSHTASQEEIGKLIGILRNTGFIIKNTNTIITNETSIYNSVIWILRLYYPTCKKSGAEFIRKFKTYKPDILIPELNAVIEYKYLRDKNDNPDDFIDQVKVDSENYTGDSQYDKFIAVLYIGDTGIATPEEIELAWKAKRMPENWSLVVTGSSPNYAKKVK